MSFSRLVKGTLLGLSMMGAVAVAQPAVAQPVLETATIEEAALAPTVVYSDENIIIVRDGNNYYVIARQPQAA